MVPLRQRKPRRDIGEHHATRVPMPTRSTSLFGAHAVRADDRRSARSPSSLVGLPLRCPVRPAARETACAARTRAEWHGGHRYRRRCRGLDRHPSRFQLAHQGHAVDGGGSGTLARDASRSRRSRAPHTSRVFEVLMVEIIISSGIPRHRAPYRFSHLAFSLSLVCNPSEESAPLT